MAAVFKLPEVQRENARIRRNIDAAQPYMRVEKPSPLPGTQQQKIDFKDERIAEDNLNLIGRVRSQYARSKMISVLDNTEFLMRQKESKFVRGIMKERERDGYNNHLIGKIVAAKPEINFGKMEEEFAKRRKMQKIHGQTIDFQRKLPVITSEEAPKREKPKRDVVHEMRQKLYQQRSQ